MKFLRNKATVMPLAVAATLAFGMPQASAQGLFDMLFGGGVRHNSQGEFPPPPKRRPPAVSGGGGTKKLLRFLGRCKRLFLQAVFAHSVQSIMGGHVYAAL